MEIKNLQRAKELAVEMPAVDEARKALASDKSMIEVVTSKGEIINIPNSVRMNIINVLNCEYERLREEVRKL